MFRLKGTPTAKQRDPMTKSQPIQAVARIDGVGTAAILRTSEAIRRPSHPMLRWCPRPDLRRGEGLPDHPYKRALDAVVVDLVAKRLPKGVGGALPVVGGAIEPPVHGASYTAQHGLEHSCCGERRNGDWHCIQIPEPGW